MSSSARSHWAAWGWPGVGLTVLAGTMALFLPRVQDGYHAYEASYSGMAVALGLGPALVAATLLIELARHRSRGDATDGLTIASLVAVVVAVPAGLVATTMLGVS